MKILIILFDSALELIPEPFRDNPLIQKEWNYNVKKKHRGILLDGAIHRSIVNTLQNSEKRGRPDIIHQSLMNICYSPLFKERKIKLVIHTLNNICINVPSDWRVPVNYNRFCGLISQLLLNSRVPISGTPILSTFVSSLDQLIGKNSDSSIYICEKPYKFSLNIPCILDLEKISLSSSITFLIGGFQHGESQLILQELNNPNLKLRYLKLYDEIVPTWIIAAKIIHWLETKLMV